MQNPQEGKKGSHWTQCQNCHKTGELHGVRLFACGACKNANYCSTECQKAQWKIHKPICKLHVEAKQTDIGAAYNEWNRKRRPELILLASLLLFSGPRPLHKSHMVMLSVKFNPPSNFAIVDFDEEEALGSMEDFDSMFTERGQARPSFPEVPHGDTMVVVINIEGTDTTRILPLIVEHGHHSISSGDKAIRPRDLVELINQGFNPGKSKKKLEALTSRLNMR